MKKVLYVSNIEVPYRVRFFNGLSYYCDLTVLYERKRSGSRDKKWTESEKSHFKREYMGGINIGQENSFSLKAAFRVLKKYDSIIIGCYNSPVQMLMIALLRIFRKPYILNFDGEVFADGKGLKNSLKRFFIRGAEKYLVAGNESGEGVKRITGNKKVIPYYFSSLSKDELALNSNKKGERENNTVLVVGQFLDVKGLDVALKAAAMNKSIKYKFIGMGNRTEQFIEKFGTDKLENVEAIPFLCKEELEKEYKSCSAFVLPSRQECWGLVINEAASFGTPIVSTWGSGAAVEFLAKDYPQYLAVPGDEKSLYNAINALLESDTEEYSRYLIEKSNGYSIEHGIDAHRNACDL